MNIAGEIKKIADLEGIQTANDDDMVIIQSAGGGTKKMLYGDLRDEIKKDFVKENTFELTNVNGWKRALEFKGVSLALNFALSSADAMAAVSGVLNAVTNTSCLVSQLSSRDVDRLHRIDKVGVLFRGDRTCLFVHTPENIANIKLTISGSYQEAVYQNEDEDLPDGAYIYDFKVDSGIVADRAIATESGTNIDVALANKGDIYKIVNPVNAVGWYRICSMTDTYNFSLKLSIARNYQSNPVEIDIINISSIATGDSIKVNFGQIDAISNVNLVTKLRVGYNKNGAYFIDVYYNTTSVNVLNIMISDYIDGGNHGIGSFGCTLLEDSVSYYTEKEYTMVNAGSIAEYATKVDPAVFTTHKILSSYVVTTDGELNNAISDAFNNAPPSGRFEFLLSVNVGGLDIIGGRWYFEGYKDGDTIYGWILGRTYDRHYGEVMRIMYNGSWQSWVYNSPVCYSIHNSISCTTNEEIENFLNMVYVNNGDESKFEVVFQVTQPGLSLGGGTWYVSGYRSTLEHGYQEIRSYTHLPSGMQYFARSRYAGVWNAWKNMVPQ